MSAAVTQMRTASILPMLRKQTWAEFIKLFRVPAFSTTSIVLPAMFYAFIGLGQAKQPLFTGSHVTFGEYFLASMALYGVANVMVLGFGISLANERGQKQDLSAIAIAVLALVALFALAAGAGGVDLSSTQWLALTYRALLCSIPFIGLGFALGYLAGPNSAPAVTNLIYLPTAFASGLFFPLHLLPQFLQNLAPYLPLYRGAQLVWDAVGAPTEGGSLMTDSLYMAGFTVAFFALALWAYRRDQGRKFN